LPTTGARASLSERENYLRCLEFRYPEWVPIEFELPTALWLRYADDLEALVMRHPLVFPHYRQGAYRPLLRGRFATAGEDYRDDWGCLWHNTQPGILGRVVEQPLKDWAALARFRPPEPGEQYDWRQARENTEAMRGEGRLTRAGYDVTRGGFFDRLQFLRGLDNLLLDFADEPPQLWTLIEMLLEYNLEHTRRWLEIGVDQVYFHGDIGTQRGLLFSPAAFRKYLKPAYRELFLLCRRAGAHVWYSSDGRLLEIVDDLIECGATLHDPQVGANTLPGIAQAYKGRLCAAVDIDEQMLPFGSPEDIRQQVRQVVATIGSPAGGLMIYAIPSADVPLASIEALCLAWEECR
jgi:uroporphyrinogen decarboxylase